MSSKRLDRNIRFFGKAGQDLIRGATCAVVGVGGLGTHVVQQASLLGVGGLNLIDDERLDETNLNRYVGVTRNDIGELKVDLGERLAHSIEPTIRVTKVPHSFVSDAGFAAIREADYVFGCLDSEGARLILNELCAAYSRPYFDLASDILPEEDLNYGGRVCAAVDGGGCICCLEVLDQEEAGHDLEDAPVRADRKTIYGVDDAHVGRSGPSVVSINGVVASLAMTEFMVTTTGLREPQRLLTYYGTTGKVTARTGSQASDCWCCSVLWGLGAEADIEHYIRDGIAERLR